MSFEIVTDSAANLPEEMIEQYNLHVLSLSFLVDDDEFYSYEKGKTTDLSQFYQMMRDKKDIRTSLVNIEDAMNLCGDILKEGKNLLYIGFSSGLSGTFQSVSLALQDLKELYPNQKIYYVDTLAAALGEGLLVHMAADLKAQGKPIEEVYQWVIDNRLKLCHWFTVDDLFFLKRGGRVSATSAVIGTALNIKPVMHVDNEGHLIVMEKVRGRKKALDSLISHMDETVIDPENQWVYISHGDCIEDAEYVAKNVKEKFNVRNVLVRILDPVIGAHSGPGTVALFFTGNKR
jgi:DegV family protein with EDD domain